MTPKSDPKPDDKKHPLALTRETLAVLTEQVPAGDLPTTTRTQVGREEVP